MLTAPRGTNACAGQYYATVVERKWAPDLARMQPSTALVVRKAVAALCTNLAAKVQGERFYSIQASSKGLPGRRGSCPGEASTGPANNGSVSLTPLQGLMNAVYGSKLQPGYALRLELSCCESLGWQLTPACFR